MFKNGGYMERELYHYGVKGMKWGIRRNRQQLIGGTNTKNKGSKSSDRSKTSGKSNKSKLTSSTTRKRASRKKTVSKTTPTKTRRAIATGAAFATKMILMNTAYADMTKKSVIGAAYANARMNDYATRMYNFIIE